MHIFPYPSSSPIPPITVPYVADRKYSLNGPYGFDSFIEGDPREQMSWDNIDEEIRNSSRASLIQSWLFFGLASEALGRDIDHKEFFTNCGGNGHSQRCIDMCIPTWFYVELHKRFRHLRKSKPTDEFENIVQNLRLCYIKAQILVLNHDAGGLGPLSQRLELVFLSVHMLLFVISDLLRAEPIPTHSKLASTRMLFQRMIENGWCQKRLNVFKLAKLSYPSLYFLSSFPPLHAKEMDHSRCTQTECSALLPGLHRMAESQDQDANDSAKQDLLPPLHRTAECQCQNVPVPLDKVVQILEEDGIPLVRFKFTGGVPELQVVRYTDAIPFVAISHVWSDRQFGSKQNALPRCQLEYLDSILETIPLRGEDQNKLRHFTGTDSKYSRIDPTSKMEWLFWLDTFCIPQDPSHNNKPQDPSHNNKPQDPSHDNNPQNQSHDKNPPNPRYKELKIKAMNDINYIYGAASQTLILDAGLQGIDAGRKPTPGCLLGQHLFIGPSKERILEALALVCGSTWMGRAWTFQEGVVSSNCVFSFQGSLVYVRILHILEQFLGHLMYEVFTAVGKVFFGYEKGSKRCSIDSKCEENGQEHIASIVTKDILALVKKSLEMQDVTNDYPRGAAERIDKFIFAHNHLQSRTTTKAKDLPLILANSSHLNGNFISQSEGRDKQMRSILYALGSVPIEFLFSNCKRIKNYAHHTDGWIPCEVIPETLSKDHLLTFNKTGFNFPHGAALRPYRFYLYSDAVPQTRRFFASCVGPKIDETRYYRVQALGDEHIELPITSEAGGCMLIHDSDGSNDIRGAQFVVTRFDEDKVFLRFICPLRLFEKRGEDTTSPVEQALEQTFLAQAASSQYQFSIERTAFDESLGNTRPHNFQQLSNSIYFMTYGPTLFPMHLKVIAPLLHALLVWLHVPNTLKWTILFVTGSGIYFGGEYILNRISKRALEANRAQPWNLEGPWGWFWKLMNFIPPIGGPSRAFWKLMNFIPRELQYDLVKLAYKIAILVCFALRNYWGVGALTIDWLRSGFDRWELLAIYGLSITLPPLFMWTFDEIFGTQIYHLWQEDTTSVKLGLFGI